MRAACISYSKSGPGATPDGDRCDLWRRESQLPGLNDLADRLGAAAEKDGVGPEVPSASVCNVP